MPFTRNFCDVTNRMISGMMFITLAAIPAFAITDKGYVDVAIQQLKEPVLAWS